MTLDELEALEKAAAPGPWEFYDNGFDAGLVSGLRNTKDGEHSTFGCGLKYDHMIYGGEPHEGRAEQDADMMFIAAARNMLPKLIAVARATKALIDAPVDDWGDVIYDKRFNLVIVALAALEVP